MKISGSILVLCAIVALVHSTPVPDEPSAHFRPILNYFTSIVDTANYAITGIRDTGFNVVERAADNTRSFIDNSADLLTNRMNTAVENFRATIAAPLNLLYPFGI